MDRKKFQNFKILLTSYDFQFFILCDQLWALHLSQQFNWTFPTSEMWCHVDWYMGTNVVEGRIASISRQSQEKWYQLPHNIAIYVPTHPVSYQRRKNP